jgi:hypothetical protein
VPPPYLTQLKRIEQKMEFVWEKLDKNRAELDRTLRAINDSLSLKSKPRKRLRGAKPVNPIK